MGIPEAELTQDAERGRKLLEAARFRRTEAEELEAKKKGWDAWLKYKLDADKKAQQEEIQNFKKAGTEYSEYLTNLAELKDIQRKESLEKEKKYEQEIKKTKLDLLSDTMAKTMDLYEEFEELQTGHNRRLFAFFKAMAIAEIIINQSKAIMNVFGKPGAKGPEMYIEAAFMAIQGAIQIAAVSSATAPGFARGGLISGISPGESARGGLIPGISPTSTSDDKTVRVTSGEFFHPVDAVNYYGTAVMEGIRQKVIPPGVFAGLDLPSIPPPSGAALQAGGIATGVSGGKSELNIINITDPREIDRYLYSARGKDALINVLSSRAQSIKKILR